MKLRALVYTTEELGLPSGLLPVVCDAILDDMHPAQVPGIEPQATHRDKVVAMGGLRGSQTYTTENCRVSRALHGRREKQGSPPWPEESPENHPSGPCSGLSCQRTV